jgi:hypothetical protein
MAADKHHNSTKQLWLFKKGLWPVDGSKASAFRLFPLLLFVIFAFPRLHQDIHRMVPHHGMHGSCTYGDGDKLLCDSSCAECDFSFFMFPEQLAEHIHCFLPIFLSDYSETEAGFQLSVVYGINQLRGPPCFNL